MENGKELAEKCKSMQIIMIYMCNVRQAKRFQKILQFIKYLVCEFIFSSSRGSIVKMLEIGPQILAEKKLWHKSFYMIHIGLWASEMCIDSADRV